MSSPFSNPEDFVRRLLELAGGAERFFATTEAEHAKFNEVWDQDKDRIGRVLRAHLCVEHFLSRHIEASNPNLGSLDNARLSFNQKIDLLGEHDRAASLLRPGLKTLNRVRNRLAHNLTVEVNDSDRTAFLSVSLFMRCATRRRSASGRPRMTHSRCWSSLLHSQQASSKLEQVLWLLFIGMQLFQEIEKHESSSSLSSMFRRALDDIKVFLPHFGTVVLQLLFPGLIALAYGYIDLTRDGKEVSAFALTKAAAPALFFIMWLIGMVFRAKKQSEDQHSFRGIVEEVHSLGDLLRETAARNPDLPPQQPVADEDNLMQGAYALARSGHSLAALLQAGVAFERALRVFAQHADLPDPERIPMIKILQLGRRILPPRWVDEMHRLRMIRNTIAHASHEELIELGEVDGILDAYSGAIEVLRPV